MKHTSYKFFGIFYQIKNLARRYLQLKKHFLYKDSINEIRGDENIQKALRQMEIQIENLKKNMETYKKSL